MDTKRGVRRKTEAGAAGTLGQRLLASVPGYDVEDVIFGDLVASLFASAGSLIPGTIIGVSIVWVTWLIHGTTQFAALAMLIVALGALRIRTFVRYRRADHTSDDRAATMAWEMRFFVEASLFSAAVGLNNFLIMMDSVSAAAHVLAVGTTIAYSSGFMARNAARPALVVVQVACTAIPTLVGFLIVGQPHYPWISALLALYIVVIGFITVSLYDNLVTSFRAKRRTEYLARYDMLTGLANRLTMTELITAAIARNEEFAVFYIDLDEFKKVNDTLGHGFGDEMLKVSADRLLAIVRPEDMVARFGGDEFIILLYGCGARDAETFAANICAHLAQPYHIDGKRLDNAASIGISLFPQDTRNAESLLKNADLALYKAKNDGRATWRFYTRELEEELNVRQNLEQDLREAIPNNAFALVYQPIFDFRTNRIVSCEALLRWLSPTRGMVLPHIFMPAAEQTGLINDIGEWVLLEACRAAAGWSDPNACVSVNLSVIQFRDPVRLIAAIRHALDVSKLDPTRLELEITETLLLENNAKNLQTLAEIRALNVHIALDDFGVGYSSLSYLSQFPFSKVKIDMVFTKSVTTNKASKSIISAVCQIAHDLDMNVVVEGIETPEQQLAVMALGATQGQGFLLGRPVAQFDVETLFSNQEAAHGKRRAQRIA